MLVLVLHCGRMFVMRHVWGDVAWAWACRVVGLCPGVASRLGATWEVAG